MNGENNQERVSTFDRVAATPLHDLARGQLTGRLSPKILCHDAALPDAVRSKICATTRRTRLLRGERSEVARELIAHFGDGIETGRAPYDLVESFGDTRTAARLIRRAKKRDRSLALKFVFGSIKALGVLVLVIVLTYAVLAARYYGAQRGPVVDYLPQLAAKASAVPEDQRAWPMYRAALIESGIRDAAKPLNFSARPGWRDWPAMAEFVDGHAETLDRFREGSKRRGLGFVPGLGFSAEDQELWPDTSEWTQGDGLMSGSLIGVLLPQLGEIRFIVGLLAADARLAGTEGDGDRAARDLIAMLRLAAQSREIPIMINDLVAVSIAAMSVQETLVILSESPGLWSDEQLRDLTHSIAAFPGDGEPLVRTSGERMIFEDAVQRLYSLDADGNGVMVSGSLKAIESLEGGAPSPELVKRLTGPVAAAVIADRKQTLDFHREYFDAAEAWIRIPAWERPALEDPLESIDTLYERARFVLPGLLTPSLNHALRQGEQFEQQRSAAPVAIAVELYRRAHGALPKSLEDLTPDLLPRVPIDMFDGKPIKYRLEGNSFVLYSIGNDYTDDGGRSAGYASRWLPRDEAARRIALVRSGAQEMLKRRGNPGELAPGVGNGDWILSPPVQAQEPPSEEDLYPELDSDGE